MVGGKLKVTFIYCNAHVWAMNDGSSAKTRLLTAVKSSLFPISHSSRSSSDEREKWNHLVAPTLHNNTHNNSSSIFSNHCTFFAFDDLLNVDDDNIDDIYYVLCSEFEL